MKFIQYLFLFVAAFVVSVYEVEAENLIQMSQNKASELNHDVTIDLDQERRIFDGNSTHIIEVRAKLPILSQNTHLCFVYEIGEPRKKDAEFYSEKKFIEEAEAFGVKVKLVTNDGKGYYFSKLSIRGDSLVDFSEKKYKNYKCLIVEKNDGETLPRILNTEKIEISFQKPFQSFGVFWLSNDDYSIR